MHISEFHEKKFLMIPNLNRSRGSRVFNLWAMCDCTCNFNLIPISYTQGGYIRNFGAGMNCWDPQPLAYTKPSSAEFYPTLILDNTLRIPPYPKFAFFSETSEKDAISAIELSCG